MKNTARFAKFDPYCIEIIESNDFEETAFILSDKIFESISLSIIPSTDDVESFVKLMDTFIVKYFDKYLSDLNINDTEEKYKPELEAIKFESSALQFNLTGSGKSHRYLCALFFNNKETFSIDFPGINASFDIEPKSILFVPVCMTYRFKIDDRFLPMSALCLNATVCY